MRRRMWVDARTTPAVVHTLDVPDVVDPAQARVVLYRSARTPASASVAAAKPVDEELVAARRLAAALRYRRRVRIAVAAATTVVATAAAGWCCGQALIGVSVLAAVVKTLIAAVVWLLLAGVHAVTGRRSGCCCPMHR